MIKLKNISKEYVSSIERVKVLSGINLDIQDNQFISIIGPSGSGKTTLLQIIGLLEPPTEGELWIDGENVSCFTSKEKMDIRRNKIGFVFQHHQLLPSLTAIENIMLPVLQYKKSKDYLNRAEYLLERIGLSHRRNYLPSKLSGGEQQRIAIARAIMNDATYILADELTGNLDSETSIIVMDFLKELQEKERKTIIVVTHDMDITRYSNKVYSIKNQLLTEQKNEPTYFL